MKGSAITRIILYSLLLLILVGILIAGLGVNLVFRNMSFLPGVSFTTMSGGTVANGGAVTASTTRQIEIDWIAGDIRIETGDTDQIQFHVYGDEDAALVWKQSGTKLHIQIQTQKRFFGLFTSSKSSRDLVITVPRDWVGQTLDISSVSADIRATDTHFDAIGLSTFSGRYTFDNCETDSLSCDTFSGDIHYTGTLKDLDLDSFSGSCTAILTAAARSLNLDSFSGDLTVTLPEGTGYTASIDSFSGRLTSDYGNASTYGDGQCRIDADTFSGGVSIRKG